MPDLATLLVYIPASFLLLLVPGPTVALIVSKSLAQGTKVALPLIAGTALGGALAAILALAGVSALLMASSAAFNGLKLIGAIYLFYLGFKLWRAAPSDLTQNTPSRTDTPLRVFRDGFLVMLLNPKTILFFAAFVPQFIDPSRPYAAQAGVLIILFILCQLIVDTGYALLASKAGAAFRSPRVLRTVSRSAGTAMIGAGLATLLARRPQV